MTTVFFDSFTGEFFKCVFDSIGDFFKFQAGERFLNFDHVVIHESRPQKMATIFIDKIDLLPLVNLTMIISTDDFHKTLDAFETDMINTLEYQNPFHVGDRVYSGQHECPCRVSAITSDATYLDIGSRTNVKSSHFGLKLIGEDSRSKSVSL